MQKVNDCLYDLEFFPEEREKKREQENEERKEKKEHGYRMRELELRSSNRPHRSESDHFNVASYARLVPEFAEKDVDKYFLAFERAAGSLKWPKDQWPILLWSKLKGKALATYSALAADQAGDYDILKQEILKAYELVPEAYRIKFRRMQKNSHITHVEFAREKTTLCDRWLMSLNVQGDFDKLRELLLLEDFKQTVSQEVKTYLEEHKYEKLMDAAKAADEYALTHKQYKAGNSQGVFRAGQAQGQSQGKNKDQRSDDDQNSSKFGSQDGSSRRVKCGHCSKSHATEKCWVLHPEFRPKCTHCDGSHATAKCYRLHPELRPQGGKKPVGLVQSRQIEVAPTDLIRHIVEPVKDSYREFKSEGFVSMGEGQEKSPIMILRDTGSAQSLIVDNSRFQWGEPVAFINIQGVDCSELLVPLYSIWLESEYMTGLVTVGKVPRLPMEGVDMILGNDIAGPKVKVTPRLSLQPCVDECTETLQVEYPGIFPACVTTRSQSKQVGDSTVCDVDSDLEEEAGSHDCDLALEGTLFADLFSRPNAESGIQSDARLNRESLVSSQESDTTLTAARSSALACEEADKTPVCYYVNDGILMRKWRNSEVPANESWNEVHQVVLTKLYKTITCQDRHPNSFQFQIRPNMTCQST